MPCAESRKTGFATRLWCSAATAVLKCRPLTTSRVPAWRDKCGVHKTILSDGIFTALPEAVNGGSLSQSRTFNGYGEQDGEVFTISGQGVSSWSLAQDDNGQITQKIETVDGITSNYDYTYDPMGRLITVTKDGSLVEEYDYDVNGTRIYEMNSLRGIAGRNFTYSDEDHLLTAGTTSYQYDVDGFLTTKTEGADVTTYDYSSRGELLSVTLPGGSIVEYVHDPLGRRIAKIVDGVTGPVAGLLRDVL